jgi:hypothetical protein
VSRKDEGGRRKDDEDGGFAEGQFTSSSILSTNRGRWAHGGAQARCGAGLRASRDEHETPTIRNTGTGGSHTFRTVPFDGETGR